jgi:hypothetical protein
MGDGKPISCRECNHYSNGCCKAYNTVVNNADLVYMLCPASDRVQSPPEVSPPSFVVGLGEKIVAAEVQSSPKLAKPKRKRKKKPVSVG